MQLEINFLTFTGKRQTVNFLSAQDVTLLTQRKQQQRSLAPCGDFAR